MANCAYCGTKLDDNAKFCTACGAQVEQAPVQPEAAQQSETVQGSYTAPTQGSYTAPAQGSYTAPAQGSYTAPAQDSYTAPAQGSYTAPQQGTYTPAQSYTPPVQTPTSAAADSGSYTPPVQSGSPEGNYTPKAGKVKMPKMPKAPAGKKRLLTLGGIALAVILLIALVSSCGGGADADDPNLGVYNAVTAEMWGMEMPITDMFENGVSIELKEKGKCVMNIDGTTGKGKWTLEDGVFYAEAGGAELNGTLEKGVLYAENVLDMGVNLTFEKEGGYVEPIDGPQIEDPGVAIESSGIEKQWDGTWYGVMYVYEAEGDFAGIPSDAYDAYMVVDVDDTGYGSFEVYFAGVDEPFAVAECNAMDYGMDAVSGRIVDMVDMDTYNWMFRPVPDYPDRYTITDYIEYDDSLFEYTLFFKQWGKSWQDEIDGDEIIPPSVDEYEAAIANGELPPVGFAPIGYAGSGTSAAAVVEDPSVWYGWASFTEFENIDSDDLMYDAWAFVEEDDEGNTYIRIHQDGYPDTPLMFMYAEIKGNKITPVIGSEDAWFSDTYLAEEDADMYEGVLGADGVLRFDYFFTHYDGEYGYRVQMNFRVDGTEWDEDNDILPPRYDEYKAALAGGASESQSAQAEEPAPAAEPAQSAGGPSGFGGEHTATIAEFMTDIPADFTFTLPERGWVLEVYSDSTIYLYNVPTPDDAYSDSPRIQFELKENLDKINFYKDNFDNLKEIDSRTIGGIEMTGRTYKNVGMEWTEYYGELPSGVWVTCKISDVDISAGTEGAAILDSVKIS